MRQPAESRKLQVRSNPAPVPELRLALQVGLLPWNKAGYRVDPSTSSCWLLGSDVHLVEQDGARPILRKVLKSLEVERCDARGSGRAHFVIDWRKIYYSPY